LIGIAITPFLSSGTIHAEEPGDYGKVVGVYATIYCLYMESYMTEKQALNWGSNELINFGISKQKKDSLLKNPDFGADTSTLINRAGGCGNIVRDPYYKFKKK
jgi:hypothetical protein